MDSVLKRLQLAAELAEEDKGWAGNLPDAAAVAAECSSWGVEAQLKLHQAEGVAWLIRRHARGVNVILGDEMGLGKTLQSMALLAYLVSRRLSPGPFLILSPLSVTDGWASELARFAPNLTVLKYVGDKKKREDYRKFICDHVNKQPQQSRCDPALPFHVLLTTYELAVLDATFLSRFCWRFTVIDEAQRLKNPATVLYQVLQGQYMIPRRLLLTGTPVQNNLSELWSLLHFCMPLVFDNLDKFLETFASAAVANEDASEMSADVKPDSSKELLELLRRILGGFMLRRTKATLVQTKALVLPPVVEVTVFAPMVPVQKKVYVSLLRREAPRIAGAESTSKLTLQNVVIQLRKACSHPYLFDGVEPEPFEEGEHLVQASGKLLVLDMMLKRLHSKGHHVLLFAQMTRTLDIIQDYLQFRGYTYERLDGSIRAEERFAAVRSFSRKRREGDSDGAFVFLLTTRAGGVGLNLAAADTVIFYEQDWNPQADKQALQRAHRIGQLRSVLAINLITENTFEEVIMERAKTKLQLMHNVIGRDDADLEEHGLAAVEKPDLQSMIVFGLQKIVSQPVSSMQESDKTDMATKITAIVERALDQRAKIDTADLKNDGIANGSLTDPESSFVGAAHEAADLNQLLTGEDDDKNMNLSALRSLATNPESGSLEANLENAGGRTRRLAHPVDNAEAAVRKKRKKEEAKQRLWESLGYKSLSVNEPDLMVNSDELMTEDREYIHHLVGDCTRPSIERGHTGIIFWCLDNSDTWGRGGVFTALARLSEKIPEAFEDASEAEDLHLGDLHLIPVPGSERASINSSEEKDQSGGHLLVAFAVVQSFDRRRNIPRSDISFPHLEICIRKLAASAARLSASVHMPRINAGNGWYMVERLLRKYATMYRTHFNVYYFKRNDELLA